jgi:septum site-determining protein MinD
MTRIIGIISGKGGVGKTTTVANLGAALVEMGKNVIILDANVTTPNLSLHLGIPFYPITLHDVIKRKAPIEKAIYNHSSGLKVIPASLAASEVKDIDMDKFESILLSLLGKADIVILDAAAGLGREALAAIDASDEVIIVTNPEIPAVTDALKTIRICEEEGAKVLGVIVNRYKAHRYEMTLKDVHQMLEVPILATITEDSNVPKSISKKTPLVILNPNSKAAIDFQRLAEDLSNEPRTAKKKRGLLSRLFFWLE